MPTAFAEKGSASIGIPPARNIKGTSQRTMQHTAASILTSPLRPHQLENARESPDDAAMSSPAIFLTLLAAYLGVGIVFAVAFVTRGVGKVDAAAMGSSIAFRLLIFPASTALWPLMLRKWIDARRRSAPNTTGAPDAP